MIVSHKHKFIFIKTRKTAGTSLEIALSKFCGPNDIITTIDKKDELIRKKLGFKSPQNTKIPIIKHTIEDILKLTQTRRRKKFYNHMPSYEIRKYVSNKNWNNYFKFCFERNPFEKTVSLYYFLNKKMNLSLSLNDFIAKRKELYSDYFMYSHKNEIIIDKIYQYEELNMAVKDISSRLNFPIALSIDKIKAKSHFRNDKNPHLEKLNNESKEIIRGIFKKEIKKFYSHLQF